MNLGRFTIIGGSAVIIVAFQLFQAHSPSEAPDQSLPTISAAQLGFTTPEAASSEPAQSTDDADGPERFTNMAVTIDVTSAAEIIVAETITAVVEDDAIRHGIERDIPLVRHHRWFNSVSDITIESATINGKPSPYVTSISSHTAHIRIGDPNTVLAPGNYTFGLNYKLDRQIGYFENFDELYWNVTGNGFDFSTDKATAVITLPKDAPVRQVSSYTGSDDDRSHHGATFTKGQDGTVTFDTTRPLAPGEAFTIAVSWPKGFVPDPGRLNRLIGSPYPIVISVVTLLATAVYFLVAWWQVGRDPPAGPEVPVYAPTLPPHAMRFLNQSGFDATCLAVAIMEICAKGYAVMEDNPADPKSVMLVPQASAEIGRRRPLSVGEQAVYDVLLADRAAGIALSKNNRMLLASANRALENALEQRFAKGFFQSNALVYIIGFIVIVFGMLASTAWEMGGFTLSDLGNTLFFAIGVIATMITIYAVGAFLLRRLRGRQRRDWFDRFVGWAAKISWLVALSAMIKAAPQYLDSVGLLPLILMVLAMFILFLALKFLPRRTALAQTTLDEVNGTRLYLTVAEADRLKFDNPPSLTAQHFSDLLPYAVALGVETDWTKQFVSTVGAATAAAPTWYSGSGWSTGGWTSSGGSFGSSVSSAVTSQVQAVSRTSGSGGGGFAGGGGGGGGASGW